MQASIRPRQRDLFIEWIKTTLQSSSSDVGSSFTYIEGIIDRHRHSNVKSELSEHVPTIGAFHTHLPLRKAFDIYDDKYAISKRKYIPPSFNNVRHILNLAQILEMGKETNLVCFDGDGTLYSDGKNFELSDGNFLGPSIRLLLQSGCKVALVTAAGYGLNGASKYEKRIGPLLDYLYQYGLSTAELNSFYVLGGECNYLFRCNVFPLPPRSPADDSTPVVMTCGLEPVSPDLWQSADIDGPKPAFYPIAEVTKVLDVAESVMNHCQKDLQLRVNVLRKERGVGLYSNGAQSHMQPTDGSKSMWGHGSRKISKESLDECVFRIKDALQQASVNIPYCVFNGGTDVWVDVGHKGVGVEALSAYLQVPLIHTMHVGDQVCCCGVLRIYFYVRHSILHSF